MSGYWKYILIYPKWLHNHPKVIPKWLQSDPKVTPKWPRSHPHTPKGDPKSDVKLTSEFYIIIKICGEHEWLLKIHFNIPKVTPQSSQSDPKVNPINPKWSQSAPKVTRPIVLFVLLVSSGPPWTSKIVRKNEYLQLMDPFGPNTGRDHRHYKCHSTSICPNWCEIDPKVTLIRQNWPQNPHLVNSWSLYNHYNLLGK